MDLVGFHDALWMPGHPVVPPLCSPESLLSSDLISDLPGPRVDHSHTVPAIFTMGTVWLPTCMNAGPRLPPICQLSAYPLLECPLWILGSISAFCRDHLSATCSPLPGTDDSPLRLSLHICVGFWPHKSHSLWVLEAWNLHIQAIQALSKASWVSAGQAFADRDWICLTALTLDCCFIRGRVWASTDLHHIFPMQCICTFASFLTLLSCSPYFSGVWNSCHMPLSRGNPCPLKSSLCQRFSAKLNVLP